MEIIKKEGRIELHGCEDFVPELTFHCGQCFRWDENGIGIVGERAARVVQEDTKTIIECSTCDIDFWMNYFDFDRDYENARKVLSEDARLRDAIEFGKGIRILRQEPWEALISFIISQCNNISRITKIIETMCANFGKEIVVNGVKRYSFPTPDVLAAQTLESLDVLRAGYRAKYILSAAKRVASGEVDLCKVEQLPTDEARKILLSFEGIGKKVADCILLFGMGKHDAFPVDVWMKRALSEFFDGKVPDFGENSGIAQQYLFYYMRENTKAQTK